MRFAAFLVATLCLERFTEAAPGMRHATHARLPMMSSPSPDNN